MLVEQIAVKTELVADYIVDLVDMIAENKVDLLVGKTVENLEGFAECIVVKSGQLFDYTAEMTDCFGYKVEMLVHFGVIVAYKFGHLHLIED